MNLWKIISLEIHHLTAWLHLGVDQMNQRTEDQWMSLVQSSKYCIAGFIQQLGFQLEHIPCLTLTQNQILSWFHWMYITYITFHFSSFFVPIFGEPLWLTPFPKAVLEGAGFYPSQLWLGCQDTTHLLAPFGNCLTHRGDLAGNGFHRRVLGMLGSLGILSSKKRLQFFNFNIFFRWKEDSFVNSLLSNSNVLNFSEKELVIWL